MLSRAFHSALSKSVRRHFSDTDGEKGEGGGEGVYIFGLTYGKNQRTLIPNS